MAAEHNIASLRSVSQSGGKHGGKSVLRFYLITVIYTLFGHGGSNTNVQRAEKKEYTQKN